MVGSRLSKTIRRKKGPSHRAGRGFGPLFEVVFWLLFAVSVASYLAQENPRFGVLPVAAAFAAVAITWHFLPHDHEVSRRATLAALAFLAAAFVVGHLAGTFAFYVVAVANGVYVFGFRRSFLYAALILALVFTQLSLAEPVPGLGQALKQTLLWVPAFLFIIGMCSTSKEAERRHEQADALLKELEDAHAKLERYAARVRELSVSEERSRVAREIHDSLGHHLTVASVQLEAAQKLVRRGPEEAEEQLGRARASVSGALSEVRRSVRALKPLAVEERSGTGALRALVRGFEGVGPVVSFEVSGEERELSQEVELALYRCLQEGLTNALKHSKARRIFATLGFEPDGVGLVVVDDGLGAHEGALESGFGLEALRQRVEALGGNLRAGNAPGGGFLLEVGLPAGTP